MEFFVCLWSFLFWWGVGGGGGGGVVFNFWRFCVCGGFVCLQRFCVFVEVLVFVGVFCVFVEAFCVFVEVLCLWRFLCLFVGVCACEGFVFYLWRFCVFVEVFCFI